MDLASLQEFRQGEAIHSREELACRLLAKCKKCQPAGSPGNIDLAARWPLATPTVGVIRKVSPCPGLVQSEGGFMRKKMSKPINAISKTAMMIMNVHDEKNAMCRSLSSLG
jgi:hypothetical protein